MDIVQQSRGVIRAVGRGRASLERGLGARLVVTVPLTLAARRLDDSDPDRALVSGSLLAVEGDLFVGAQRILVVGMRHLGPTLPVAAEDAERRVELRLGMDLWPELEAGLRARLAAGEGLVLSLRGLLERWENPLYDEDGYQKMRVGDSGLSRALQAMGQREHLGLDGVEVEVGVESLV